jgi:hypothetical protein
MDNIFLKYLIIFAAGMYFLYSVTMIIFIIIMIKIFKDKTKEKDNK